MMKIPLLGRTLKTQDKPKVISLFTGVMGLDLGFERESFRICVAVEKDKHAVATLRANRPDLAIIHDDIRNVTTEKILETAALEPGEADAITGGLPCEPFSTVGRRQGFNSEKGRLIKEFIRIVSESQPKCFLFENVVGIKSASLSHVPYYERKERMLNGDWFAPRERHGSLYSKLLEALSATSYSLSQMTLNSADYGSPQLRQRLFIIGSRDGLHFKPPKATRSKPSDGHLLPPWRTLRDALANLDGENIEHIEFPANWGRFLHFVQPGGCWRDLPENLQAEAMGGAYHSEGGRTGFLRRLSWERPSPTLVSTPAGRATCLCHPDDDRPLSVREYSRIQGFPDNWVFYGPVRVRYRLIASAVPVDLARALARSIKQALLQPAL